MAAGEVVSSCSSAYETLFPHPSWAEQRPEDWWHALGEAVRGALAASGVQPSQVAAMSVDTTCCTVVALSDGECVLPHALHEGRGGKVFPCSKIVTCSTL